MKKLVNVLLIIIFLILLPYLLKEPLIFVIGILLLTAFNWNSIGNVDINEGLRESPVEKINCDTGLPEHRSDDIDISHLPYPVIWDTLGSDKDLIKFDLKRKVLIANNNDILITFTQSGSIMGSSSTLYFYKNKDVKLLDNRSGKYIIGTLTDAGIYNLNAVIIAESNLPKLVSIDTTGADLTYYTLDLNGSSYTILAGGRHPTDLAMDHLKEQVSLFGQAISKNQKLLH